MSLLETLGAPIRGLLSRGAPLTGRTFSSADDLIFLVTLADEAAEVVTIVQLLDRKLWAASG